jgi:hypothetical protein
VTEDERGVVFFVTWVALVLLGAVAHFRASPAFKIRWFARSMILVGVLFVGFIWWVTQSRESLFVAIPGAAIVTFLNIRYTKFCPTCGYPNKVWGRGVDYCYKCGLELPGSRPG